MIWFTILKKRTTFWEEKRGGRMDPIKKRIIIIMLIILLIFILYFISIPVIPNEEANAEGLNSNGTYCTDKPSKLPMKIQYYEVFFPKLQDIEKAAEQNNIPAELLTAILLFETEDGKKVEGNIVEVIQKTAAKYKGKQTPKEAAQLIADDAQKPKWQDGVSSKLLKLGGIPENCESGPTGDASPSGYIMPLNYISISSPFNKRRGNRYHRGVDFTCRYKEDEKTDQMVGDPIYASKDGIVARSEGGSDGYGNIIVIDHPDGMSTVYGHMSKLLVRKGQKVTQGQKIAECGNEGRSTGPHLHFEMKTIQSSAINYYGRGWVDPLKYLKLPKK